MEPATWQLNDARYKHFLYRARVAEDTSRFETTSLRGTPVIVIVSHVEAETMLPVNWTLVVCEEASGSIIFSNATRKDWILYRMLYENDTQVCLKTECQADSECHHEMCLEFSSTLLATHFYKQIKGAVQDCKIGSEWDDRVEEIVDGLLDLIGETTEMDSMPVPPISLIILEGDVRMRSAWAGLMHQLWEVVGAVVRGLKGSVFPGRG